MRTRRLVNAHLAAYYVTENLGRSCAPSTIRRWVCEGKLNQYGKSGRAKLYDLDEVHEAVTGEPVDVPA